MVQTPVAEATAEQRRLAALHGYDVLDTAPESDFDDIAVLAAHLCRTPAAAVSLIAADRQWMKARVGLDTCEMSREHSFCAHAMHGADVMQVPDARQDPRFADNPLVVGEPYVRFYAGAPLVTASGQPLGSLCVVDRKPRLLTPAQCQGLRTLARHVMAQLELRRYARGLDAANQRLRDADRLKDEFIARVTHELRTPLTSINGYLEALDDPDLRPATGADFLERIRRNSDRLMRLVDDMRDTGIGISPEDQGRVLAPFRRSAAAERAEVQGAGLGLSIVKAIVDSHGGAVAIDSEPGRGAAIIVTLPRYQG